MRYVLTANAPETKDNDFTWKDFQIRNNSELVAIFGNFINRAVVLTHKYYEGDVPGCGEILAQDQAVLDELKLFPKRVGDSIEKYRFREASQELLNLARLGNKYLADEEPWKRIKDAPERVPTIMHIALQIAAALSSICEPFLPHSAEKLRAILNIEKALTWQAIAEDSTLIPVGHTIGKQQLLFEKIEDATIEAQLAKLEQTKVANEKEAKSLPPQKELISFEDFTKLDLRVGTITAAEKVKKTKKLLQLQVDLGEEVRTIVSGIAESFTPEEVVGKKVTVLTNLAPRKIRGVESQGMLLMSEDAEGNIVMVSPDQGAENGFPIA